MNITGIRPSGNKSDIESRVTPAVPVYESEQWKVRVIRCSHNGSQSALSGLVAREIETEINSTPLSPAPCVCQTLFQGSQGLVPRGASPVTHNAG